MAEPIDIRKIMRHECLTVKNLAEVLRMSDTRTIRRWMKDPTQITGPASIVLEMIAAGDLPDHYFDCVKVDPDVVLDALR